jgi:hypothetical protein
VLADVHRVVADALDRPWRSNSMSRRARDRARVFHHVGDQLAGDHALEARRSTWLSLRRIASVTSPDVDAGEAVERQARSISERELSAMSG